MRGARVVQYVLHTVDGEDVSLTLPEFLADNGCLDPSEVDAIRLLAPGETHKSGGGAWCEWSITRCGQMDEHAADCPIREQRP